MARKKNKAATQTPPPPKKKSKLGLIFLIIVGLVGGTFLLDKLGINVISKSESIELTNNPKSKKNWEEFKEQKIKDYQEEKQYEKEAEKLLEQFINYESNDRNINKDEKAFLKKMSDKINTNGKVKDAKNYFNFMNSTFSIYKELKSVSTQLPKNNADKMINDMMNIESKKLEKFSKEKHSVEEWMSFIKEEN